MIVYDSHVCRFIVYNDKCREEGIFDLAFFEAYVINLGKTLYITTARKYLSFDFILKKAARREIHRKVCETRTFWPAEKDKPTITR